MKNLIRKDLKDFKPYSAPVVPYKVKLDANESPFNLSETVRAKMVDWFSQNEDLNIYPDSDCVELRDELSKFWGVTSENIVCGVGSDQLIDYIAKAFLEPGDVAVVEKPTFSMYGLTAKLNHGTVLEFDLNDRFSLDICGIIEKVNNSGAKILFLCSPNNPTGNSLSLAEIEKIVSNVSCVVVVDEAYADFSGQTMIPFIEQYKNMVVLRTFSKAYGIAGARVGYAAACEEMIECISIVKPPYNLNTVSQRLAIEVLKDSNEYKKRIALLNENKNELFSLLSEIEHIKVYPSDANFLFIETEKNISEELEKHGILVRAFSKGQRETIRLTCGTKEQNDKVYEIIKKC